MRTLCCTLQDMFLSVFTDIPFQKVPLKFFPKILLLFAGIFPGFFSGTPLGMYPEIRPSVTPWFQSGIYLGIFLGFFFSGFRLGILQELLQRSSRDFSNKYMDAFSYFFRNYSNKLSRNSLGDFSIRNISTGSINIHQGALSEGFREVSPEIGFQHN